MTVSCCRQHWQWHFFSFLRVSKITVNSSKRKAKRRGRFLAKQDVLLAPYELQLTIKYFKMDQLGKGSIVTMGLTCEACCPVLAMPSYLRHCQAKPELCSIIPLPDWQTAVSPPSIFCCARTATTQVTITHTASE